ncbi:hypothetical protein K488DRAFT_91117 [Vararia minispora EC-137]|uniref:Uncharacterized protein n=1 Tax=Vararia minispora EC-137 TaxID=1314806 RepID=A0ACB8Q617_9AGAM|nr:hypothetical protein K488DRAFT_91117 [Vararia minispora EC-137]
MAGTEMLMDSELIRRDPKDLPPFQPTIIPASPDSSSPTGRITISTERRASASPFPSPGSSFLPPPIPGPHEFAIPPPSVKRKNKASPMDKVASDNAPFVEANPPNGHAKHDATATVTTVTAVTASSDELSLKPNGYITIPAELGAPSPPITPRPSTSVFAPSPLKPDASLKPAASPTTPTRMEHAPARNSLASSRPAPPSPAASRRASKALSRASTASSTRSRPSSTVLPPAARREANATATPASLAAEREKEKEKLEKERLEKEKAEPKKRRSMLVKIRDFAFAVHDPRHISTGPDTPRSTRRLQRPVSAWSASSAGSEDDDGGGGGNGWGVSWGLRRLSWFSRSSSSGVGGGGGDGPSAGDFARNFGGDGEEDTGGYEAWGAQNAGDELSDEDEGSGESSGESYGELVPGLYRAVYAFEPEGTAEMALEEDQVVRVVGRGGGVGWAVAVREDGEHALVPEGYLELVKADDA